MGLMLGMTLGALLWEIFSEPITLLKRIISYWWIRILYRNRRLDVYDPSKTKDLTKIGIIVSEAEQKLEPPERHLNIHTTDSVLMFGSNSKGDLLVVRICREREGHVAWILMDTSDGYSYQLGQPEKSYPSGPDFMAGGLRIKCLVPMRRWRISFNGILRQTKKDDDESQMVHIKFSFISISTGFVFDAFEDIHPTIMADYFAKEESSSWIPDPQNITRYLNRYVQPISLIGTISVEGAEESELNLLGVKHRARDTQTCRESFAANLFEILGFTKDGQMIYSGSIKPPGSKSKFRYGHYMERCGLSWPAISCQQSFSSEDSPFNGMKLAVTTERSSVKVEVSPPNMSAVCPSGLSRGHVTRIHFSPLRTNDGDIGNALVLEHTWTHGSNEKLNKPKWRLPTIEVVEETPFVLPLSELSCQDTSLSGGKGASLANLTNLTKNFKTNFKVPKGFVITTAAYQAFYNKSGIKNIVRQFEKTLISTVIEKRNEICHNLVNQVSKAKLPVSVEDTIRRQLLELFPDHEKKRKFAVRSSASGEDSEEMSAAGQMSTLLGVQGIDNILQAVVKCWSSQFSFTAIEYKRQNGQELNSLMAVVVQEMVAADIAGVLFTCDPVTGNPQHVTISANYGIGESVVSASAEPDTVVLQRDDSNNLQVKSILVGKKKTKVVMAENGSVQEKTNTESHSSVCCISPENSKRLADTSLKVEEAYGFPIDVEWAFKDSNLFLLQARPVTTFDKETKFEIAHAVDDGFRVEDEYNTKANVGEVLPDASSHLGMGVFTQVVAYMFYVLYKHRNPYSFPYNPFQRPLPVAQNHCFISMPNFVLRFYQKAKKSFLSESNIISGFGRLLDDEDMFDQADKRNRSFPGTFVPYQLIFFIYDLLFAEMRLKKAIKTFWDEEIDLRHCKNSREMYFQIWNRGVETIYASARHMDNTLNSSLYNSIVMSILATANKGWEVTVYSDFASILSSCGDIESADVPFAIEKLLKEVSKSIDVEKFKTMDKKDALEWLESTPSSAGVHYKDFIKKHGHRCLMEFDVYSKTWATDKLPLVEMLQDSVNQIKVSEKKFLSTREIIENLKVPLSRKAKFILRLLIPLSRRAVCNRERSKSLMIKHFDLMRKGFWTLAEQMAKEGRLPEKELLFFLSEYEVLQLIDTRSPLLLQKAMRRRQIFPELKRLRFPEITKGVPKPINSSKNEDFGDVAGDLEMRGVPVSQGVIKGIARVAVNLKQAAEIQRGEILIAYSTDICWSPYFPLLSGVATELGGLISHGAVVAREYGLPCVVGVFDATVKFSTGDVVLLDGTKGILKRLESASQVKQV